MLKKIIDETPITKEAYDKAIEPCRNMMLERNERYGNSIDIAKTPSIIDLCLMKLVRTRELPEDDPKYTDEIQDSLNYLTYILMRRNKWNSL